ncbi:MAG: hypothetical protein L0177_03495 [Chloroflexi bacterium]|nr:hypothetical protein [Chloroflexota bacterium]
MSLRIKRQLLRVALHGGALAALLLGALAGALAESQEASGIFALLFLAYLATLRVNPLPRLLERKLIQQVECDYCGEVMNMVGVWSCGCGFVTWQPRHGLSACPDCGKVYARLQCPRCDASIKT